MRVPASAWGRGSRHGGYAVGRGAPRRVREPAKPVRAATNRPLPRRPVLLPALLVCLTPFTRIIKVLSFVRRAVTAQDIPPITVLLGLSLFLTLFVMGPRSARCGSAHARWGTGMLETVRHGMSHPVGELSPERTREVLADFLLRGMHLIGRGASVGWLRSISTIWPAPPTGKIKPARNPCSTWWSHFWIAPTRWTRTRTRRNHRRRSTDV